MNRVPGSRPTTKTPGVTARLAGLLLGIGLLGAGTSASAFYPPYAYPPQGAYPQQQQPVDNESVTYPGQPATTAYPQPYGGNLNTPGYPGQFPGNRNAPAWPQQFPGNRNAAQPQGYWYPYQQPARQSQPPPRVETSVSDTTPYEQQSLVYRIRVTSQGNLNIATPVLPQTSDVVLRMLGKPVTTSSTRDGTREFVTEYSYLLMPLSSGVITIPPTRVSGRYNSDTGGEGASFEVSGKPVVINARPATDAVQPWLPLYGLRISARLHDSAAPSAGEPIEMDVEIRAVGTTGSQIPSVAAYLDSPDFRIYPGASVSEGSVSSDGKTLYGRRQESFTLVPRYGGWLSLPEVKLNWWNVRYNRPEVAAMLGERIHVTGPANPDRALPGSRLSLASVFFWLPMVIAVLILGYAWLTLILGDGKLPGTESVRKFFRPLLGELYTPLVAMVTRVSPRRSFHRARAWTGRHLPVSWKLWFCLRAVARVDDPADWAQALQILATKHLGVRPQAHLRQLGEGVARCHPRANAERVDRLMAELDEAVYGNTPIRDFARWKQDFRRQIKPGLFPIRFRQCAVVSRASAQLPGLNPR